MVGGLGVHTPEFGVRIPKRTSKQYILAIPVRPFGGQWYHDVSVVCVVLDSVCGVYKVCVKCVKCV
jgi:hypothetical protein